MRSVLLASVLLSACGETISTTDYSQTLPAEPYVSADETGDNDLTQAGLSEFDTGDLFEGLQAYETEYESSRSRQGEYSDRSHYAGDLYEPAPLVNFESQASRYDGASEVESREARAPAVRSGTRVGNSYFFDDRTTATRVGNSVFYSDGVTSTQAGNSTFFSDGTTATRVGDTTFYSDGVTATHVGNSTFLSDGTTCTSVGSSTFCN